MDLYGLTLFPYEEANWTEAAGRGLDSRQAPLPAWGLGLWDSDVWGPGTTPHGHVSPSIEILQGRHEAHLHPGLQGSPQGIAAEKAIPPGKPACETYRPGLSGPSVVIFPLGTCADHQGPLSTHGSLFLGFFLNNP